MPILNRRSLLKRGVTLVSLGWAVPAFIAETARLIEAGGGGLAAPAQAAGRRVLVLVQLAGGNDGLNTLVPYGDEAYYAPGLRPTLAIPPDAVLPLTDYVGLHPSLSRTVAQWNNYQAAIVQGVSYPNPSRSHFRGTDIWETAVSDRLEPSGWLGRYIQACGCQRPDHLEAMAAGMSKVPRTFWTEMALVPAVSSIASFRYTSVNNSNPSQRNFEIQTLRTGLGMADGNAEGEFLRQSILTALDDADILAAAAAGYTPIGTYPSNAFGNTMKMVAQLIAVDVGTSIFYVSLGGFDTHSSQLTAHANLLTTFDQSMDGFFQDMEAVNKVGDVTVMTFSEFGRRVAQNGSNGTDHGIAAPMFLLGGALTGGLHAEYPSLTDLSNGDLKMQVDFRSVYATVLQDWLGIAPEPILGGSFPLLPLFATSQAAAARQGKVQFPKTPRVRALPAGVRR